MRILGVFSVRPGGWDLRAAWVAALVMFLSLFGRADPAAAQDVREPLARVRAAWPQPEAPCGQEAEALREARVQSNNGANQAGLVIQFGEGDVFTTCVDLGMDGEATGEEVLRAAGFSTVIDYSSGFGGGTVCKIGEKGCDFPGEACFCQCTMKPGDPCVYWSYFHLVDGQWRYSSISASGYVVKAGGVEGWVWGLGSAGGGVVPPLIPFGELCGVSVPPPTSTAAVATTTVPPATPLPEQHPSSAISPTDEPGLVPTTTLSATLEAPAVAVVLGSAPPELDQETPQYKAKATFSTPVSGVAPESAPGDPRREASHPGDSRRDTQGYLVFAVLLVALLGGLVFMKLRGQA